MTSGGVWGQILSLPNQPRVSFDQVRFYKVPLACPTVHHVACGSMAKPVLLALEKKPTIQEAWLDREGTTMAIVWKKGTEGSARLAELQSVAEDHGISLHEVDESTLEEEWKSLRSGKQWYRGFNMDELTEEDREHSK
jgi:hypothetical protein